MNDLLTCQNCSREFDINDSENPIDGGRIAAISYKGGEVSKYHNVWCPFCKAEQIVKNITH